MADRVRAHAWHETPLGAIETWPHTLRNYVSLMLNSANPKFMAWGQDRIWLYNDAFIPILGDKHPDALGQPARKVWLEAWAEIGPMFDRVFSGEAVRMDDIALELRRQGRLEEAHFAFSYNPASDLDGHIVGLFGNCLETTLQVQAQRTAASAEKRLQFALEAGGSIGTWDWDVLGDRVVIDERFAQMYGIDPAKGREGTGLEELLAVVHPDDLPELRKLIDDCLASQGELNAEYRLLRPNSEERWIDAKGHCFADDDGKPVRLAGAVFDITARKKAELKREALVALTDCIRDIEDPDDLAYAAVEILGRTLNVSRAGYGLIDVKNETITIERDWNAPGVPTLAGTLQFRDYGSYIEDLARGETVVFENAETDPRTADTADALKAISAQAIVNMPITEQGGLVALLYLNHETARPWPEEDLALIREFAARTRTATERLRMTTALRESEARFRNMADHAPMMMWVTGSDGRCVYLNRAWYEFTGQSEADAEGFGWLEAVHPEDRDAAERIFMQSNAQRESFRMEYRLRDRDGNYRWAIDAASPRFGPKGQFLGYIGSIFDIDERKRVQNALQAETRLLETLNGTGATLAAELDLDRVVQHVTDAGVAVTGAAFGAFFYNVQDPQGERYMLYTLSGVDRSKFEHFPMPRNTGIFAPTFDGAAIVRSDDITLDPRYGHNPPHRGMPEGHLPVKSYLAVPVKSRSGEVIGGLFFGHPEAGRFTDRHQRLMEGIAGQAAIAIDNARLYQAAQNEIAFRSEVEKALQSLNDELESRVVEEIAERRQAEATLQKVQRMEAIGQLTGGVAHDFNNLLQVIAGNLQLLSKDVAGNTRAEQRVQNALLGVSRGANLASQLLAFGRRQPLEPRVTNIGRLVSGLDDMLRRALGEEVEIEATISGGLWNTFVDPGQVENALLNLAINARDAMDGRGRLTVEVGNAFLDEDYVRGHPDVDAGQYVMLAVTDTGSGMSEDIIDKVFEPFFTTKTDGRGSGLGLSMVYGFVKQSGGHVKIYSELGLGTTIKLYLPRTREAEDVKVEVVDTEVTGGSEVVLVVEDDDEVRATAVELLRELGYRVLKAPNADSALAVIESGTPIDVLFTDVVMPGTIRSPELARKAKERLPGLAVLFTSGYTENAIVHGGRLDDGVKLLNKPYTREALARKLRSVIDSKDSGPAARREDPSPADTHSATGRALRVLLVEDDALIRLDTRMMLEDLGHAVEDAGSGEDAKRLLGSKTFDVLVTDVGLPDISGMELADFALEEWPEIGIVFATGDTSIRDEGRFSAAEVLQKPYSPNDLDVCLQTVAGKGRAGDS